MLDFLNNKAVAGTVVLLVAICAISCGLKSMNVHLVEMCCKNSVLRKSVWGIFLVAGLLAIYYSVKLYRGETGTFSENFANYQIGEDSALYRDRTSSVSVGAEYASLY